MQSRCSAEGYTHESFEELVHLKNPANVGIWQGWHSVAKYGRVTPLEEDS